MGSLGIITPFGGVKNMCGKSVHLQGLGSKKWSRGCFIELYRYHNSVQGLALQMSWLSWQGPEDEPEILTCVSSNLLGWRSASVCCSSVTSIGTETY